MMPRARKGAKSLGELGEEDVKVGFVGAEEGDEVRDAHGHGVVCVWTARVGGLPFDGEVAEVAAFAQTEGGGAAH